MDREAALQARFALALLLAMGVPNRLREVID